MRSEYFIEDRQEVVERANGTKGEGIGLSCESACACQKKRGLDLLELDSLVIEIQRQPAIESRDA